MSTEFDRQMMDIALRVGMRGLGQVAPNPAVGAVIADEVSGEVIARGWTQPGGRPHAETEAIRRAGERARGKTLYVTLEPCSHHGQTGPCAHAIIHAGLSRVVVAISDPDMRVSGRGLQLMRDAGLGVETGLLADQARWLTLGHILRVTERRPFVQVKLALSADGDVPRGAAGAPTWVTSVQGRAHGALLRARADAILVGAQTIVDDDPLLTCRLPGLLQRSPTRVVLSSTRDLAVGAQIFQTARQVPTIVISSPRAADGESAQLRNAQLGKTGARVAVLPPSEGGHLDLSSKLEFLAELGITRLLVEGGPRTWRAFSDAGVVDEVVVFQAGRDGDTVKSAAQQYVNLDGLPHMSLRQLEQDVVATFRARG